VSKLIPATLSSREKGKVHARFKEWHEKYGPIVRVGGSFNLWPVVKTDWKREKVQTNFR
jgi:hypothetical protein